MAYCSVCGTQIPDGTTTCAAHSGTATGAAHSSTGGLTDNMAGALAYVFLAAILFLVMEPYNKNRFIRFHSFQAIFYLVFCVALGFVLGIVTIIPFLGFLIAPMVSLALFIGWVVLILKAYQGQMFKFPIIGDLAEKQANVV